MKAIEIQNVAPSVTVYLTHSEKKAKRVMRKIGIENLELEQGYDAKTIWNDDFEDGEPVFIVLMNAGVNHSWDQDVGLLVHEAVHVSQGYFASIGETEPSIEFQAYVIQTIAQDLCVEHFEWKRKQMIGA